MAALQLHSDWELRWAPYDQATYDMVLAELEARDVILDIGAGDLRLSRQMAARVERVYAVEINPALPARASRPLPDNLVVIEGDARYQALAEGITCGVLLMRHTRHYPVFAARLRQAGAARLITNARWGMSVETVDLSKPGRPYERLPFGWYACQCGATGFKPGPAEALTPENVRSIHEVCQCPACGRQMAASEGAFRNSIL